MYVDGRKSRIDTPESAIKSCLENVRTIRISQQNVAIIRLMNMIITEGNVLTSSPCKKMIPMKIRNISRIAVTYQLMLLSTACVFDQQ